MFNSSTQGDTQDIRVNGRVEGDKTNSGCKTGGGYPQQYL
jgi:hypothetical protein